MSEESQEKSYSICTKCKGWGKVNVGLPGGGTTTLPCQPCVGNGYLEHDGDGGELCRACGTAMIPDPAAIGKAKLICPNRSHHGDILKQARQQEE